MKAYKLTDSRNQTKNNTVWGPNVTHTATGTLNVLCTSGWIHFYTDPIIAVVMNPVHANFIESKLWECNTEGEHLHEALKSGCKTLTTVREIPLPEITLVQRVAFAILSTKKVCSEDRWNIWADNWLSDKDRSAESAARAVEISTNFYAEGAATAAWYAAKSFETKARMEAIQASKHIGMCVDHWFDKANAAVATTLSNMAIDRDKFDFVAIANKALTYT